MQGGKEYTCITSTKFIKQVYTINNNVLSFPLHFYLIPNNIYIIHNYISIFCSNLEPKFKSSLIKVPE